MPDGPLGIPLNTVPPGVAGELEALVQGRGPFADAEELSLKREEDISIPDPSDPQIEDDADAVQADILSRLEALEQSLVVNLPPINMPILLPDQNVEFGLATGNFSSNSTIALTPCDVDGTVTGEANVTVYTRADRATATEAIADDTVVSWQRFDTIASGGQAGVLAGGFEALGLIPTRGDVVIANSTPVWAKLSIGTATYVLTSDGTDVAWAAVPETGQVRVDALDTLAYLEAQIEASGENIAIAKVPVAGDDDIMQITHTDKGTSDTEVVMTDGDKLFFDAHGHYVDYTGIPV